MKKVYGDVAWETKFVQDRREGWSAIDLLRSSGKGQERVARVIFWDAQGHFFLESFGGEVYLSIIEELILEAKEIIKTR